MVSARWHLAHCDARRCQADEAETRAICPTVPYRFGWELALRQAQNERFLLCRSLRFRLPEPLHPFLSAFERQSG